MIQKKFIFPALLIFNSPAHAFECWGRIGFENSSNALAIVALTCFALFLTLPLFTHHCFEIRKVFFSYCLLITLSTFFLAFIAGRILCISLLQISGWTTLYLAFILAPAVYQYLRKDKDTLHGQPNEPWLAFYLTAFVLLIIVFKVIFFMPLSDMVKSFLIANFSYPLSLFLKFVFNTVKFSWLNLKRPKNQSMLQCWFIPSFVSTLLISYPTALTSFLGLGGRISTAINTSGLIIFFFAYVITLVFFAVKPTFGNTQ